MKQKKVIIQSKLSSKFTSKWFWENLVSLVSALFIVFIIRSSIVQAFKIPSGSMLPTLHIGDHIFVNMFAYGLKLPFSETLLNRPIYLTNRHHPKRGDVIVFKFPEDDLYYIKRVIGEPGDTIEIKNKILYINQNEVLQMPLSVKTSQQILQQLNDPQYPQAKMRLLTENLDQVHHSVMLDDRIDRSQNFGPVTIPAESLFAMGDNRDWSGDSRIRGFIPIENVVGKATVIWLSYWLDFTEGNFSIAPGRIGTFIH